MVTGIDLNMKWNDYSSDTLYLWNGNTLYKISEGSGDALFSEDYKAGYIDYWLTDVYSKAEGTGGQWMEKEFIKTSNYTIQGLIDRMMECDLWDDNWKVINEKLGDELSETFERYWRDEMVIEYITNRIKED